MTEKWRYFLCTASGETFAWLGWPRKLAVPSPLGDVKIVSPISTFVLNTLTLKWKCLFFIFHSSSPFARWQSVLMDVWHVNSGSPLSFPVCSNKTKGGVTQDDFKRNIALQHCRDIVSNSCNIFPTLRYIKSGRFIEILWAFLIKELFHSRLLDMRWLLATISYPTCSRDIIVKYDLYFNRF